MASSPKLPSVLHETYYSNSACLHDIPRIVTVFDMIDELFNTPLIDETPNVTQSHLSKGRSYYLHIQEYSTWFNSFVFCSEDKTTVVLLGFNPPNLSTTSLVSYSPHNRPYSLCRGRSRYKNFSSLLQAYAQSSSLRQDIDIIAFGGSPFPHPNYHLLLI